MTRNRLGILVTAISSILCFTTIDTYAFSEGYILTGAYSGTKTVLLDSLGKTVHEWDHSNLANPKNGYSCYLLKNGHLLRSAIVPDNTVMQAMAPAQGILQELDAAGNIVWNFQYATNDSGMLHHDMKPMPNGHILAVSFVPLNKQKMIAAGIDTALLKGMMGNKFILSEKILEIDPTAAGGPKIVWQWNLHDHVIPDAQAADHPELISGSIIKTPYYTNQWTHLNGLDYNAKHDLILFSSRVFSECFIIDHSTTTQEAASHTGGNRNKGGDLLYRWGNPANYKATGATKISVLHCVNWIPEGYPGAGNIIFFHNNTTSSSSTTLSQVIEIQPPMDEQCNFSKTAGQPFAPTQPTWLLAPTDSFFSSYAMSAAFRLPNGNTLVLLAYPPSGDGSTYGTKGNSIVVEADKDKNICWKFTLEMKSDPGTGMMAQAFNPAKIMYYPKDYEGVKNLLSDVSVLEQKKDIALGQKQSVIKTSNIVRINNVHGCKVGIFNIQGKNITSLSPTENSVDLSMHNLSAGVYYAKVIAQNNVTTVSKFSITR